jgi:O-methyltransferase
MPKRPSRLQRAIRALLRTPQLLSFVVSPKIGADYGLGFRERLHLLYRFRVNNHAVDRAASTIVEHLELAKGILAIPPDVEGAVVECGCFKGGVSVNLSLVCEAVGRRLLICDSFEGLPPVADYDEAHVAPHHTAEGATGHYEEGEFSAGSIEVVKENLRRHGSLEVCDFLVGYFDESMAQLDAPVAMAFLDVDLIDSLRPCLVAIWPRLSSGCRVYVHEADDLDLVATFFERDWWEREIGGAPPGFIGAGIGLPLGVLEGSGLGYAEKKERGLVTASRTDAV